VAALPAGEAAGRGIAHEAVLVLLGDVAVEVLGNSELAVQLLQRDAIVGQVDEAIFLDGLLRSGNQFIHNCLVWGIELGKINLGDMSPLGDKLGGCRG
jgi:hypothetical protein